MVSLGLISVPLKSLESITEGLGGVDHMDEESECGRVDTDGRQGIVCWQLRG